MTVFGKEIKQGFPALLIWTLVTAAMMVVCVAMFPEMKGQMDSVSEMFANMGGFTAAFGMDKVNFGDIIGFYGVECGNVIGIGGGLFAAYIGIMALSKEEKERTAEFLLTHPLSRGKIITQKLLAVLCEVTVFNVIVTASSFLSIIAINESVGKSFYLIHIAFYILQIEVSFICFGISAFIRRGGAGIGLGIAAMFYFLNIIRNLSDKAGFLKYFTPFAFSESADIISDGRINISLLLLGAAYGILFVVAGYVKYIKKDITA